jgi:hypothetical protein
MTKPGRPNKNPDPLSVQVSFRVRVPKGTAVSKRGLNAVYENWIDTGELPHSVEIRGIFWKNPTRNGKLADWRWSAGSDLGVLIPGYDRMTPQEKAKARHAKGVESSPRGDHEEARDTLGGALRQLHPFG